VVFTGSDDNTDVGECIQVATEYPWVEFGVLIGKGEFGNPKYPSRDWFARRTEAISKSSVNVEWSLHVCDAWAGDLAHGIPSVFTEAKDVCASFNRMQLNMFREMNDGSIDAKALIAVLQEHGPDKQYIFQLPDLAIGYSLVAEAQAAGLDALGFFDPSAGRGISPDGGWPCPSADYITSMVGFAGGLGPHNLQATLETLTGLRGSPDDKQRYWVDMETNVRTDNKFDLQKVRTCLDISRSFLPANSRV
jgi:hypothetical protein